MTSGRIACLGLVAWLLAACGSAPTLQSARPAAYAAAPAAIGQAAELQVTNHMVRHLNADKSVRYVQNQGGGGATLGVLLGPFGVAANIAAIGGVTDADVAQLGGKVKADPVASFRKVAAAQGYPLQVVANGAAMLMTPYLQVSKTNETTLHLTAGLVLEGQGGSAPWTGRYQVQLPGDYTVASLAALDAAGQSAVESQLDAGFASLLQHLRSETAESIAGEPKITYESEYLSPRFGFEMAGSLVGTPGDMVWVRGVMGVQGVRKDQIRYQRAKP